METAVQIRLFVNRTVHPQVSTQAHKSLVRSDDDSQAQMTDKVHSMGAGLAAQCQDDPPHHKAKR